MLVFADKHTRACKRKMTFIITVLMGMIIFCLAMSFPVGAQDEEGAVTVNVDQELQKADFTVDESITLTLTGVFTINEHASFVYFGIYAPEGWETTISPEEASLVTPGETIPFEGEVRPSSDATQEEYEIVVWASADKRDPSPGEIMNSPSVFRGPSIIEVIHNRVRLLSDILGEAKLPGSSIIRTFTVTNKATVTDTFFIDIVGDETLTDQGWVITQSADNLTLEPGETRQFTVEEQIPSDALPGDYTVDVDVSSQDHFSSGRSQSITTKVRLPKIYEPFWTLGLVLMVAFVGTSIGLAAFLGATEIGYLALLSLFLPLYVRLKRKDVLSHFIRGQIFGYIRANPGEHYNAIIQHLGLHNGVGAYHLQVLEREGFIKSLKDGIYKRFYPTGVKIPERKLHLSRVQRDILGEIKKHPGVTQKQIAKLLEESKQVVNYHIKILESIGLIRLERTGRATYCFAGKLKYVPHEDTYEIVDEKSTVPMMQI